VCCIVCCSVVQCVLQHTSCLHSSMPPVHRSSLLQFGALCVAVCVAVRVAVCVAVCVAVFVAVFVAVCYGVL